MNEKRLQEIEALVQKHGNVANPDGLTEELCAEVRKLRGALKACVKLSLDLDHDDPDTAGIAGRINVTAGNALLK